MIARSDRFTRTISYQPFAVRALGFNTAEGTGSRAHFGRWCDFRTLPARTRTFTPDTKTAALKQALRRCAF